MKKVIMLVSVLFLVGCSHPVPKKVESCQREGSEVPQWICSENSNEGFGVSQKSNIGLNFSRKEAISNALEDLSFKIETNINAEISKFQRQTGKDTVDSVLTHTSKQDTKNDINYEVIHFWINPSSGTNYALIRLVQTMNNSYDSNESLYQQFKANQELKKLK